MKLSKYQKAQKYFNSKTRIYWLNTVSISLTIICYSITIWLSVNTIMKHEDTATTAFICIITFLLLFQVPIMCFNLVRCFYSKILKRDLGFNDIKILYENSQMPDKLPRVAVIHCCANDFIPKCMNAIMKSTYKNLDYFICDDSTDKYFIDLVNKFAEKNNCCIVRRPIEHKKICPTKGGNWHYFVNTIGKDYDYVVMTDSGTILERDFIDKNIRLFYTGIDNLAIVQGYHCAYPKFSFWERIIYRWDEIFHRIGVNIPSNVHNFPVLNGFGFIIKVEALLQAQLIKLNTPVDDNALFLILLGQHNNWRTIYSNLSICSKIRNFTFLGLVMQFVKWTSTNLQFIFSPKRHIMPINRLEGVTIVLSLVGFYIYLLFSFIVLPIILTTVSINFYIFIINIWMLLPSLLLSFVFGIFMILNFTSSIKSLVDCLIVILLLMVALLTARIFVLVSFFSQILKIKMKFHVTQKTHFKPETWKSTFKKVYKYDICILLWIFVILGLYFGISRTHYTFDMITLTILLMQIFSLIGTIAIPFIFNSFSYISWPVKDKDAYNWRNWVCDELVRPTWRK